MDRDAAGPLLHPAQNKYAGTKSARPPIRISSSSSQNSKKNHGNGDAAKLQYSQADQMGVREL